jgi:hypothetical protein
LLGSYTSLQNTAYICIVVVVNAGIEVLPTDERFKFTFPCGPLRKYFLLKFKFNGKQITLFSINKMSAEFKEKNAHS